MSKTTEFGLRMLGGALLLGIVMDALLQPALPGINVALCLLALIAVIVILACWKQQVVAGEGFPDGVPDTTTMWHRVALEHTDEPGRWDDVVPVGHPVEQRLRIVDVGNRKAAGHGERAAQQREIIWPTGLCRPALRDALFR